MNKIRHNVFFFVCLVFAATSGGQPTRDPARLFAELCQPSTTDHAWREILTIASKDASARQYIVQRLPEILDRADVDHVWLNAVSLAGKLKAEEAIPALQKKLSLGKLGGPHVATFTTEMRLDDDVVAKALSQIGNAAIPAVTGLLVSENAKDRRRAVLILRNMGTKAARTALQDHLPEETDQTNKKLIESWLGSNKD